MKKIIAIVLSVACLLGLVCACGEEKTKNSSSNKFRFGSETEMKNAVDGVWLDGNLFSYFTIRDGKLTT